MDVETERDVSAGAYFEPSSRLSSLTIGKYPIVRKLLAALKRTNG